MAQAVPESDEWLGLGLGLPPAPAPVFGVGDNAEGDGLGLPAASPGEADAGLGLFPSVSPGVVTPDPVGSPQVAPGLRDQDAAGHMERLAGAIFGGRAMAADVSSDHSDRISSDMCFGGAVAAAHGNRTIGCLRDFARPTASEALAISDRQDDTPAQPRAARSVTIQAPSPTAERGSSPSVSTGHVHQEGFKPPSTGSEPSEVRDSVLTLGCVRDFVAGAERWGLADDEAERVPGSSIPSGGGGPCGAPANVHQLVPTEVREFLDAVQDHVHIQSAQTRGTDGADARLDTLDDWISGRDYRRGGNTISVGSRDIKPALDEIFGVAPSPQPEPEEPEGSAAGPLPCLASDVEEEADADWDDAQEDAPLGSAMPPPPCKHNNWDNVRVKKGYFGLRCRDCRKPWKVPAAMVEKCPAFFSGYCPNGPNCPLPHINRHKAQLKDAPGSQEQGHSTQGSPPAGSPVFLAAPQAPTQQEAIDATFAVPGMGTEGQKLSAELQQQLEQLVLEKSANPGFIEAMAGRPCRHNNWDNVRMVKGKIGLRCRSCGAHWKAEVTLIAKCPAFFNGFCPNGVECVLPHIHRYKNKQKEEAKARQAHEGPAGGESPVSPAAGDGGFCDQLQMINSLEASTLLGEQEAAARRQRILQEQAAAASQTAAARGRGKGGAAQNRRQRGGKGTQGAVQPQSQPNGSPQYQQGQLQPQGPAQQGFQQQMFAAQGQQLPVAQMVPGGCSLPMAGTVLPNAMPIGQPGTQQALPVACPAWAPVMQQPWPQQTQSVQMLPRAGW
eukprot:TRINITY_DN1066_c0_g1_i1.p1 TRINITY_DN1066_c0_g1~~TRINITY_DN1066_c0_g1_i1.p1  ORF type:complete len:781 (+),score=143.31 TRINITY_DN1066_c0_g1_i1:109-2451(+)